MRYVFKPNTNSLDKIRIVVSEPKFFNTFPNIQLQIQEYQLQTTMINIFQFLKQGTSLSRHSHHSNQELEQQIISKDRQKNHTYEQTGRFHDSDSDVEQDPEIFDEQQIEAERKKKVQRNHQFNKKYKIKVNGLDCPQSLSNFTKIIKKYQIKDELIKGLCDLGYEHPTPVQMQVVPCILEKRNVVVTAPTGTGKTLSFLLPILNNLSQSKRITAVIMVPLQQLANQILDVLQKLGSYTSIKYQCCSKLTKQQIEKIENKKSPGYNILVATPLTFLKLFEDRKFLLKQIQYVVLDECDKCFEQSFFDQMKRFLSLFSKYNPTFALFSATIQNAVQQVLTQYLDDCIRIEVGGNNKVLTKIDQSIEYCTNQLGKLIYIKNMITQGNLVPPVLIFVQEKTRAKQLYYELKKYMKEQLHESKRIEVLSSDKSKDERQKIITQFDQGKFWVLITTDIVARGIDFRNVNLVINYDFPNSMLTYIHRVGRTGRAERQGTAITFFTEQDKPFVRSLANLLRTSGCVIPDWIAQMPKAKKQVIKKYEKFPVKRLPVGKADGRDKQWEQELQVLQKKWQKIKTRQLQKEVKKNKKNGDDGWITVGPE